MVNPGGKGVFSWIVAGLLAGHPVGGAETPPGQPGSGKRRFEQFRERLAERGVVRPPALLPENLAQVEPTVTQGRVNLPVVSGQELGSPLTTAGLDELLATKLGSLAGDAARNGGRISDDQFVRRVYLDVVGRLPAPADIEDYVKSRDLDKKARLVDKLLAMPQYGTNWARYWRDVARYRATEGADRPSPFGEEAWLAEHLNRNTPWDSIAAAMIRAQGLSTENPAGFLLALHRGEPAEAAGEIARIFLGTQINCAQCHDHPTDTWKRDQFHEFASFVGKTAVRLRPDLREKTGARVVIEIGEAPPRKQYRKPDLNNPSALGKLVQPVFLTGQAIPLETTDAQRRQALATWVTSRRNPLFAKAFVNRIWAELVGQGFTNPVDDLGAHREVALPEVFEPLGKSFAASGYDIKALFRLILNSRFYDRQFHEAAGDLSEEAIFAGIRPTRLSADQIFDSIDWVLGGADDGRPNLPFRPSNRGGIQQVFGFDPSIDRAELEGSIPQALALMNHPTLNARIDAGRPGTLLHKLLATRHSDKEVVTMLYLRVLARKPTGGEVSACLAHVRQVGERAGAFEDILWALLNTTEFLNNH